MVVKRFNKCVKRDGEQKINLMTIFNIFKKKKDNDKKEVIVEPKLEEKVSDGTTLDTKSNWSAGDHQVIKSFYISEKASMLNGMNQYVFKVFSSANKSEIKKQVEKVFDVKIKDVKMLNMPHKRRDIGKHPGFKSGFKKAIVVLKEGYSIEQAKS